MAEAAVVAAVAGVIGAGAAVVNTIQQRKSAKRAAAEQRKQRDIQNRQQSIERQRQIRQAIAAQRVQVARQAQGGILGSSATSGQISAFGADLAGSMGAANTQMAAQYGISQSQNREAGYAMTAQYGTGWGTFAQFAQGISSVAGGYAALGGGGGGQTGAGQTYDIWMRN